MCPTSLFSGSVNFHMWQLTQLFFHSIVLFQCAAFCEETFKESIQVTRTTSVTGQQQTMDTTNSAMASAPICTIGPVWSGEL